MLGKLFKHEFRAMSRIMLPVMAALIVLSGLGNISVRYIDNVKSDFLSLMLGLFIAAFFLGMFATVIILVVVVVSRFYTNLLKDEGYLMFTLPVSTHELVWSKLLVSLLWYIITALVIWVIMWLTVQNAIQVSSDYVHFSVGDSFKGMLRFFSEEYGVSGGDIALIIIELVALACLGILTAVLHFYSAMSIGYSFANRKVLLSVVFFLVISFAAQIAGSLILEILVNTDISIDVNIKTESIIQISILFYILVELVYGGILYFITNVFLKKKLNL